MTRIMDENEVFKFISNRNIDTDIIKPTMIDVAQENFLLNYFGDFYLNMIDNSDDYIEYIDTYLKPIVAWSVLYLNYDYISYQITDKGIIQLLMDNTAALISRDNKVDAKMEIKRNIYTLIKQVQRVFEKENKNGNPLFKDFKIDRVPSLIKYKSEPKKINIPY